MKTAFQLVSGMFKLSKQVNNGAEEIEMKYIKVKNNHLKDRNDVIGETVFSFDANGVATIPVKGATVMQDIAEFLKRGGTSIIQDVQTTFIPVKEKKVKEVEIIDSVPTLEEIKEIADSEEDIVILDESGSDLQVENFKPKKNTKNKKKDK